MESIRDKLNRLYSKCMDNKERWTSLELRLLDIAFNAVNSKELSHVVETTRNIMIQDYAMVKLHFFKDKGL